MAAALIMDELTDPETLRERDDAEFIDAPPEAHQGHFEVYEPIAGMAISGVTDADGRLLLLRQEDERIPVLPYGQVSLDGDWVTAAREAVAVTTGVAVTIDGVVRVRRAAYRSETGAETTGYDVVFSATPVGDLDLSDATGLSCRHEWSATWNAPDAIELPDDEDNDVVSDIRSFL
ncbi:hypothetical protein [Halomarina pelagica]|uniref:hypothetical protein n=1 Tax=Halomarina pelagica TaxID=2961599 RepID=UPI0020C482D6|nr:hypothetical protein [Halomarina sp. BND7]